MDLLDRPVTPDDDKREGDPQTRVSAKGLEKNRNA
jgi:hypothetical protein